MTWKVQSSLASSSLHIQPLTQKWTSSLKTTVIFLLNQPILKRVGAENMGLALSLIRHIKANIKWNPFELETLRFALQPFFINIKTLTDHSNTNWNPYLKFRFTKLFWSTIFFWLRAWQTWTYADLLGLIKTKILNFSCYLIWKCKS